MSVDYLSAVANHLWQSTVFAGAAGLLALALRTNHAAMRHGLWTAASLKFLVPFALLIGVGSHIPWRTAPAISQSELVSVMKDISVPFAAAAASAPNPRPEAESGRAPIILFAIWMCGSAAVAFAWLREWLRVRRTIKAASPLQLKIAIPAFSTAARLEPGVFGIFRPVLLLPAGITDRLTERQLEAILVHELCHVRRRDNLAALIHMLVETLFWFHPLVWWIERRLMEERERACDEEVLRVTGDPNTYAEGILNVCKFYKESSLVCMSGVTGSDLKNRIEAIMTNRIGKNLNWFKKSVLSAAACIAVAGPITIGLLSAQAPNSFSGLQTTASKVFDVATVKLNPSGDPSWRLGPPAHGAVSIENLQLHKIIASSFRVQDSMILGPGWLDSTRYNIVGKGPDPNASNPEVWEMMRSLLAERFKMKYHIESRDFPIYAMTVARGGTKLKNPADGRCAEDIRAGKNCGDIMFPPFGVGIYNMPIGALIGGLGRVMQDRPIVDKTGLTGKYDVTVTWMPEGMTTEDLEKIPKEARPEDISLFEAMEKQAGLKLEAQRGPIQVVVIDSIDRPSEN